MRNNRIFLLSGISTLLIGSLGLAACGDDDPSNDHDHDHDSGVTPDTGTDPDPENDGGVGTDSGSDADTTNPNAVRHEAAVRLGNAINPYGLTFGSDGKLYVAGATNFVTSAPGVTPVTTNRRLAVWRLNADNTLDTTFGTDGVVAGDYTGDETAYGIVETSAGEFVVQFTTGAHGSRTGKVFLTHLKATAGVLRVRRGARRDQVRLGDRGVARSRPRRLPGAQLQLVGHRPRQDERGRAEDRRVRPGHPRPRDASAPRRRPMDRRVNASDFRTTPAPRASTRPAPSRSTPTARTRRRRATRASSILTGRSSRWGATRTSATAPATTSCSSA